MKERKDRVDDGLHATRAAVEEGIVPGGGVALARASLILAKLNAENDDQRVGIEIVRKAAQMPMRQIAENAGEDGAVISGKVLDKDDYNWGFDAQTGEFKDMVKAGIIDPTKVVRVGIAARSVGRFADDHHRGDGGGAPGKVAGWQWIIRRRTRRGLLSEAGYRRRSRPLSPGGFDGRPGCTGSAVRRDDRPSVAA